MLFDLRGSGRRRTIQVIYLSLAILMGGGLVLFGVGGATSGGLLDAFQSNGGSSSDVNKKRQTDLEKRVTVNPKDAKAWAELARVRYSNASTGDNYDPNKGFTDKGIAALKGVETAWDRYLALKPAKPDDSIAGVMVRAFVALEDLPKATTAQELVVDARPSTGSYSTLAQLAYAAGQARKGDLASAKAVSLAPKDQRESIKSSLEQAKTQAVQQALQETQTQTTSLTP